MSTRHFWPLFGLLLIGLVAQTTAPSTAPAKLAVPTEGQRADALAVIQKLFKDDYARKSPQDSAALGQRLLKEARGTHDDAVSKYVLLDQACMLAAAGGDPETTCAALDDMNAGWVMDPLPRKAQLLAQCLNHLPGAAIERAVAIAFNAMDQAAQRDDYVLGARFADIAEEAAGKKQSVAYSASIQQRLRDFRGLAEAATQAKDAARKLEAGEDAAAHLVIGKYLALGKGDFANGLPHLVRGSDAALAAAAQADLANPTGTDAQVKLGDLWWAIAESQTDYTRAQTVARAQYWYRQAKSTITGITLTKINSRLNDGLAAAPTVPGALPEGHVNLLSMVDADKDAVAGAWKRVDDALVITPEKYSRLQLPIRAPDEYDLTIRFTRTEVLKNNEGTVAIMLTYKDKSFDLALQASGNAARFESINKTAVKDNPTIVPLKLDNNSPYTVLIEVRKTGVRASLDGKPLTEYKTDYADMSGYASWKLKDTSLLGIGANSAGVRFEKIELTPVTGQPRLMRPAPK